jgi:hypothetical protein
MRYTGHHAQALLQDGPEVGEFLEIDPFDVLRSEVGAGEIGHETLVDGGFNKVPVCKNCENGLEYLCQLTFLWYSKVLNLQLSFPYPRVGS